MSNRATDRAVLRLSDDWAILADRNQWMVAKRSKRGTETRWKPLSYVGSTKSVLARVSHENGAVVTPQAQAVSDTWPEKFSD